VPIRCPFWEKGAVVEADPALPGAFGGRLRVAGQIDADHADPAGGADGIDQAVQHHLRVLLAGGVVRLVADGLDAAVGAAAGRVHDLPGRVAVGDVDWGGTEAACQFQPVGLHVHHEDLGRPAQVGAVGGEQPDRARAVDATVSPGFTPARAAPW
jgi:hypothetical protein